MSRAFVRETDAVEELPERPISPHPNFVTAEGLTLIEAAVARLQREHVAAQAANDRAALARLGRDLRYWNARRASAQVIAAPSNPTEVQFGCTVTILREDGRRQTYRIVGEDIQTVESSGWTTPRVDFRVVPVAARDADATRPPTADQPTHVRQPADARQPAAGRAAMDFQFSAVPLREAGDSAALGAGPEPRLFGGRHAVVRYEVTVRQPLGAPLDWV